MNLNDLMIILFLLETFFVVQLMLPGGVSLTGILCLETKWKGLLSRRCELQGGRLVGRWASKRKDKSRDSTL
jgi:hypothetical protein